MKKHRADMPASTIGPEGAAGHSPVLAEASGASPAPGPKGARAATDEASPAAAHRPICPDCRAEIIDPLARRYRYPFTACIHCGPRQPPLPTSVTPDDVPSASPPSSTAMEATEAWPMCAACRAEWHDASGRRHHAPFVACHACGPRAWLERTDGAAYVPDMHSMLDAVDAVCTLLQQGHVVAVPTPAGYRLAVQATHAAASVRLPRLADADTATGAGALLLLARTPQVLCPHVSLSARHERLLEERKVVPLPCFPHGNGNASAAATTLHLPFDSTRWGHVACMLSQTALQVLMLRRMEQPVLLFDPVAAELANAPLPYPPAAREQLRQAADYILMQDAWWPVPPVMPAPCVNSVVSVPLQPSAGNNDERCSNGRSGSCTR